MTIFDRLYGKTVICDNGCWEFIGARYYNGYGVIRFEGRNIGTHRLSYILCIGPIPKDYLVLHKCDNRSCINPDHLFAGTQYDNIHDCINKGRKTILKGVSSGNVKLTEENVRSIRLELNKRKSLREIAERFNVGQTTIFNIKHNIGWKSVQ